MEGLVNPTPALHFPDIYETLLWRLLRRGIVETNERTGKQVKVYPFGPMSFSLDLSSGVLPVSGNRKLFPSTAAAETAWYLMGTQDPSFMMRHAKVVWEKFVEPSDAGPIVKAAYGYRWRRHFGRDQIALAVEALRANPTDRRIWVNAWDPSEDGLGAKGQLNVPCPVGFSFSILDGRLQSSYLLRSSDVFVGLPYDVMGHAMLMSCVATDLGVPLGHMHFTLAHPHIYDVHWDMAMQSIEAGRRKTELLMMRVGTTEVAADPEAFVEGYKALSTGVEWASYHCRPEVVQ